MTDQELHTWLYERRAVPPTVHPVVIDGVLQGYFDLETSAYWTPATRMGHATQLAEQKCRYWSVGRYELEWPDNLFGAEVKVGSYKHEAKAGTPARALCEAVKNALESKEKNDD